MTADGMMEDEHHLSSWNCEADVKQLNLLGQMLYGADFGLKCNSYGNQAASSGGPLPLGYVSAEGASQDPDVYLASVVALSDAV